MVDMSNLQAGDIVVLGDGDQHQTMAVFVHKRDTWYKYIVTQSDGSTNTCDSTVFHTTTGKAWGMEGVERWRVVEIISSKTKFKTYKDFDKGIDNDN